MLNLKRTIARQASAEMDEDEFPTSSHALNLTAFEEGGGGTSDYRGFGSSISSIFSGMEHERIDTCSIACCGILQFDRSKFLLMGSQPSSCFRRMTQALLIPMFLVIISYAFAFRMPITNRPFVGEVIGSTILVLLILYVGLMSLQYFMERKRFRRELLFQKYQRRFNPDNHQNINLSSMDGEEGIGDAEEYLEGQTNYDISCAHMFVGCYTKDDHNRDDTEKKLPPTNFCASLSEYFSFLCCGICGTYLQCCGMCAVAQEARDVEHMFAAPANKFDYVTMQPVLQYYAPILELRIRREGIRKQVTVQSSLTFQILQSWCWGTIGFCIFWFVGGVSWRNLGLMGLVLSTQVLLVAMIYWPNYWAISFDLLVKSFTCGFLLCSTMAFAWEACIALLTRIFLSILLHDDLYQYTVHDSNSNYEGAIVPMELLSHFGQHYPWLYVLFIFVHAYVVAALSEEIAKYLGYRMVANHPDLWTKVELDEVVQATKKADHLEDWSLGSHTIATEVQDFGDKQRCRIIMVSMVTVAIGFAAFENLLYGLLYNRSYWRALFPIHPVCAAWQSIRVCRRDVEIDRQLQFGRIILPSVLLHGTFDFIVLLVDFISQSEATQLGEISSSIVAVGLLIAGAVCALIEYSELRNRLQQQQHNGTFDFFKLGDPQV